MYSLLLLGQMIIDGKDQSESAVDGQSDYCLRRGSLVFHMVGNIGLLLLGLGLLVSLLGFRDIINSW